MKTETETVREFMNSLRSLLEEDFTTPDIFSGLLDLGFKDITEPHQSEKRTYTFEDPLFGRIYTFYNVSDDGIADVVKSHYTGSRGRSINGGKPVDIVRFIEGQRRVLGKSDVSEDMIKLKPVIDRLKSFKIGFRQEPSKTAATVNILSAEKKFHIRPDASIPASKELDVVLSYWLTIDRRDDGKYRVSSRLHLWSYDPELSKLGFEYTTVKSDADEILKWLTKRMPRSLFRDPRHWLQMKLRKTGV